MNWNFLDSTWFLIPVVIVGIYVLAEIYKGMNKS